MFYSRKKHSNPFDEFKDKPLDEIPPEIRSESAYQKIIYWVEACLLMIHSDNELSLSPRAKLAIDIFFLGGIDYICQCHNLDEKWYGITAVKVFDAIGYFSELSGVALVINHNNFLNHDFSHKVLFYGGNLCKKWYYDRNRIAPTLLCNLVKKWNETPEPPTELETKVLLKYFWNHGGSQLVSNDSDDSE